ncbi:YufK family protein [Bacillus sp. Marseille-Q3570]|uniref:YufK family protein n=1 Tax=Bacillus sp. Marseille-Q3570 TaxID=2963522 RepID=UPI0021B77D7A|nr:YufK family protein [Bacillus sp. Marseille-Q3570]
MGKNTYLTGYFPLFAIILFSASFGFYSQVLLIGQLERLGIYRGMTELFSIGQVQVALWFVCALLFFMLFAALKLISDTLVELSLFFFSKESEGDTLKRIRGGSSIFLIGSLCSIVVVQTSTLLPIIFLLSCFIYFFYFVFKASNTLSIAGMFGLVFMHLFFWVSFSTGVTYSVLKVYKALMSGIMSA